MVEDIGEILKGMLSGALYADRLAGVVSVINYDDKVNNKVFTHRLPASVCDVDGLDCGEDKSRYKDLVPNSNKRSVIFFEDLTGAKVNGIDRGSNMFVVNLRLVAWVNRTKLGKTDCSVTAPIMNDIIKRLQTHNRINSSPYTKMTIKILRILPKTPGIFSRYTFPLTDKQYLIYPFDYFAMDIQVKFNMNTNCLDEYVLGVIDECNV